MLSGRTRGAEVHFDPYYQAIILFIVSVCWESAAYLAPINKS